jgi:hypothetical protein
MTIDAGNQDYYVISIQRLRDLSVKTEPPFTRVDINNTQQVVNTLKNLMTLPLSN